METIQKEYPLELTDRMNNRDKIYLILKDVDPPFDLSEYFRKIEAQFGEDNCMFEAGCNAFGIMPQLHGELRKFFAENATDKMIDTYSQDDLHNFSHYKWQVKRYQGGDFENSYSLDYGLNAT
jgi:hypothetical protein